MAQLIHENGDVLRHLVLLVKFCSERPRPGAVQQLIANLHPLQHLSHGLSFWQASLSLLAQIARLQKAQR